MHKVYAVYGASGCGRSLMPIAKMTVMRTDSAADLVFIDDGLDQPATVNGYLAMNYQDFIALGGEKAVLIAIANSKVRETITNKLTADGIALWSVQADTTLIMDAVTVGNGAAHRRHRSSRRLFIHRLRLLVCFWVLWAMRWVRLAGILAPN